MIAASEALTLDSSAPPSRRSLKPSTLLPACRKARRRNPLHAAAGGLVLDLLAALNGNPAAVAVNLGVSTTAVIKLLEDEPHFWAAANRIRAELGLGSLTHRR